MELIAQSEVLGFLILRHKCVHIAYLCGVSKTCVFMSQFLFKYLIKVIFGSEEFLGVHFFPLDFLLFIHN